MDFAFQRLFNEFSNKVMSFDSSPIYCSNINCFSERKLHVLVQLRSSWEELKRKSQENYCCKLLSFSLSKKTPHLIGNFYRWTFGGHIVRRCFLSSNKSINSNNKEYVNCLHKVNNKNMSWDLLSCVVYFCITFLKYCNVFYWDF